MAAVAGAAAGCSDAVPLNVPPVPTASASATPTGPPAPFGLAPITSEPAASAADASRSAVAVSITMRPGAPTPVGLSAADYVFEEVVAVHNHRLLAIFQSHDATRIGPVGPVATMDKHVLPALHPIVANDGGPARFMNRLLTTKAIVNRSYVAYRTAYTSSSGWLYTSTAALYSKAPVGSTPPNLQPFITPSLRMTTGTDKATSSITVTLPGEAGIGWTDDTTRDVWVRKTPAVSVTNLIIMTMPYESVPTANKPGSAVVRSATVIGQGSCLIASGGFSAPCTWRQGAADGLPDIVDAGGFPVRLAPGTTWVMYVPTGTKIATG